MMSGILDSSGTVLSVYIQSMNEMLTLFSLFIEKREDVSESSMNDTYPMNAMVGLTDLSGELTFVSGFFICWNYRISGSEVKGII